MLTFPKRPRRDQTIAADQKLWTSKCRQYRVAFSRCRYGPHDERGIPDVCYAQHFDQEFGVWDVLSRHRSRNAAAETPPQKPANDTPVWRTVRSTGGPIREMPTPQDTGGHPDNRLPGVRRPDADCLGRLGL
ncbi:MAG: hypothetical protein WCB27_14370 [Thermoguttaceae bacterium]